MAPLAVDDEALALDEIKAVGPGGNHLARPYTRKHFRQIWQSDLFDTTRHDALGRPTGRRRCSTACGRGSRSCAPSRAPSSCPTT